MINFNKNKIIYLIYSILMSIIIGFLSGTVIALFLKSLNFATLFREQNLYIIFLLPVIGFVITFIYGKYGRNIKRGFSSIIDEVNSPNKIINIKMGIFIYISTFLSHLFGASVGREGAGIQIVSSMVDQIGRFFGVKTPDRKIILISSIAAAFSGLFGTPFAGAVFVFEIFTMNKLTYKVILPVMMSSIFSDYFMKSVWKISHANYIILKMPKFDIKIFFILILLGLLLGLLSRIFILSIKIIRYTLGKYILFAPLRSFLGGIIIVILTIFLGTYRYNGLGIESISDSFIYSVPFYFFALKFLFTIISLASGFKGGEITSLFFIGSTFGSYISRYFGVSHSFFAGLGLVGIFAGAANMPLTCIVLSIELFGANIIIYSIVVCIIAYIFSGNTSIYEKKSNLNNL